MRHAAATFAIGLISLSVIFSSATALAEDIELRIDGEIVVLEGATLTEENGRIVIRAGSVTSRTGDSCDIKLTGAEHLSLAALSGNHISIFMDGNSRLSVDHMTASVVQTTTDGFSRVYVQASE